MHQHALDHMRHGTDYRHSGYHHGHHGDEHEIHSALINPHHVAAEHDIPHDIRHGYAVETHWDRPTQFSHHDEPHHSKYDYDQIHHDYSDPDHHEAVDLHQSRHLAEKEHYFALQDKGQAEER